MNLKFASIAAGLILALASTSSADIITYPDIENTILTFSNITESSLDSLPLFGQPSLQDDSLVFDNPLFSILTSNNNLEFVDGRVTASVSSKGPQGITSFNLTETGTYEILGDGIVSVSAIAFAVAEEEIYQGSFQFEESLAGSGTWTRSLDINFAAPVTTFSLVIDNQLFASANSDSTASIGKDNITITVNAIPEPSIAWLAMSTTLLALRRRR